MHIIRNFFSALFILVLLTILSKSVALAGDYASRDIIGFSSDGRYFAYEQYGVQDGSGFPYSEIFIINTENDSWVSGSPVKILLQDEKHGVKEVREDAMNKAQPLLKRHDIREPEEQLASNPRAEISADPHSIAVNTAYQMTPPSEQIVRFSIKEKSLASERCGAFTDNPIKGFTLTLSRNGQNSTLQDDDHLPESRGCPLGYSFADIYRHVSGEMQTFVILLHMEQVGFEGPDSRFLAVSVRLP